MKFISLFQTIPSDETPDKNILKEEFKAAVRAGEGRMGSAHLFYRYFINVKYVPYQQIKQAYLRVESGESGEFLLKEFYLILKDHDNSERKLRFEREENVRVVLDHLTQNHPQTEIGYKSRT